ncbi:MAG: hypothetical protein L0H64_24600, partial [Pseudonocardia sp.]|nr:hypothetical protein [Pseudonocardia sp.]
MLGRTDDTVTTVAQLPAGSPRSSTRVDEVVEQAVGVLSRATPVVAQAAAVARRADVLVDEVSGAGRSATALV